MHADQNALVHALVYDIGIRRNIIQYGSTV